MENTPATVARGLGLSKRTILTAWAAVGLPLATVLAVALRPAHSSSLMVRCGALQLAVGITQVQTGTDRVGGHAAVVDTAGDIHVLHLKPGGLTEQVLPAAEWGPHTEHRIRLTFVDQNSDDLLDLIASEVPRGAMMVTRDTPVTEWRCGIFTQHEGRFGFDRVAHRYPAQPAPRPMVRVQAGGMSLSPQPAVSEMGSRQLTRLVRAEDDRVVALVPGMLHSVVDFDEDGNDDLLTIAYDAPSPSQVVYRLFLYRKNGYQQVWQAPFTQGDPEHLWQRFTQVVDLTGSGRPVILIAEPRLGRLTAWTLDPHADLG